MQAVNKTQSPGQKTGGAVSGALAGVGHPTIDSGTAVTGSVRASSGVLSPHSGETDG